MMIRKIAVVSGLDHTNEAEALFEWLEDELAGCGMSVVLCKEYATPEIDTTHIYITCCKGCQQAQRQEVCEWLKVQCPAASITQVRIDQIQNDKESILDKLFGYSSEPDSPSTLEVAVA